MPELINEGETGFLVSGVEEAAAAVEKVRSIDRARCRREVERRFSVGRMVDDYLRVYTQVVRGGLRAV
jgi:glycosyltransferase involved in cell wall biosynthesis